MQEDICLCFINYAKVFDKLRQKLLFELQKKTTTQKLDLYAKRMKQAVFRKKTGQERKLLHKHRKRCNTRMSLLTGCIQPLQRDNPKRKLLTRFIITGQNLNNIS